MKFSKPAARTYTASTTVDNGRRVMRASFRLDGRDGAYRVDIGFPGFGPWEAIDGGEGFSTVAEAKRYAHAYQRAITAEGDFTPHRPAR